MGRTLKRWLYPFLAVACIYFIVRLIQITLLESVATAATVWAAFGALVTVVVALVLAYSAMQERAESEAKKHAAAAIIISRQLYSLRAILDVVAENEALVRADKGRLGQWLSRVSANLRLIDPIIQDKHLPIVTELPPRDLFTLSICDQWFNNLRNKHLFPEPTTLALIDAQFDSFIDELLRGRKVISPASERLHLLSGVSGPPPWATYSVPSWVVPPKA